MTWWDELSEKARDDFWDAYYELFYYFDLWLYFSIFFVYFFVFFWFSIVVIIYFEIYNWFEDQLILFKLYLKVLYFKKKINLVKITPNSSNISFFNNSAPLTLKSLNLKIPNKKLWEIIL